MAYHDTHARSRNAAAGPRGLFGSIVAGLRRRHAARQAERRLMRLDDHMLRDLGIERGQIEDLVHGGR
jgi:uncharacterized protein YjiS (DUF1127 family)